MADDSSAVSPFAAYLAVTSKNEHPELSRRARKLRLVQEFWALPRDEKQRLAALASNGEGSGALRETMDGIDDDVCELDSLAAPGMGIIVRADFSDDDAWTGFYGALRDAEKELAAPEEVVDNAMDGGAEDSAAANDDAGDDADSDSSSDEEMAEPDAQPSGAAGAADSERASATAPSLFTLVSPSENDALRTRLANVSNIGALRLYNDVDVVPAPKPPPGTTPQRTSGPKNRLIDVDGFVEAYRGNLIWVYDTQSNRDRSVRLVNQRSTTYGAATGDSWRPRASFLPELQLHLCSGAMTIDFGGLDRWDHGERLRNLAEAESYPGA